MRENKKQLRIKEEEEKKGRAERGKGKVGIREEGKWERKGPKKIKEEGKTVHRERNVMRVKDIKKEKERIEGKENEGESKGAT